MKFILPYLVIINAVGLVIMLIDKEKAKRKLWRIPESTLMGVALLGGSIGTLLGMKLFRHKTKHLQFTLGIPLILGTQILLAIWLLTKFSL